MSLKQVIKQKQLLQQIACHELVLPGEPLIYCIKYRPGQRMHTTLFLRNKKWNSFIKSFFKSYYNTKTPVVVLVDFFVTPAEGTKVKEKDLINECIPATRAYEICDYLLAFLEMLHKVVINSYKQIVKIESNKFYSKNPRTVFKFMHWDTYVNLQNNDTNHTKTKS